MAKEVAFSLPFPQNEQRTERDLEVQEQWEHRSLRSVAEGMVEPTVTELSREGDWITMFDKRVEGDRDDEAIAFLLPYHNGYTVTADIRASYTQDILITPQRMLIFPNGKNAYNLTTDAGSNAKTVLADAVMEAASKAGVDKLHIVGPSQGATIGGYMLHKLHRDFDVENSTACLLDPPNVGKEGSPDPEIGPVTDYFVDRTLGEMTTAFRKSFSTFGDAVNDSGIPALSEAFHTRGGVVDSVRGLAGQIPFVVSSYRAPFNKELRLEMAKANFLQDLTRVEEMPRTAVVARFMGSLICPRLGKEYVQRMLSGRGFSLQLILGNYGHSGPDNVPLFAKLVQTAVEPQEVPHLYGEA